MPFTINSAGQGVNSLVVPGGYTILEDSGITEAVPGESGPMATVKFKVLNANDRYSFVNQLLGKWTGAAPSSLFYIGPYEYPPSPNLLCTSITSIESFSKKIPIVGIGLPWFYGEQAIVTAVFTRPPWQAATNGGYFNISYSGGGEFFTVPETTYQFSGGVPTNTPIGIFIPQAEITVTRYRMPFLPDTIAVPLYGTLNNAAFGIGYAVYAQGSLLFVGMDSETESDPLGNITYQVRYKFMFRPIDWNFFFNPNRTSGFSLVTDGNGNPPYNYANFNVLP